MSDKPREKEIFLINPVFLIALIKNMQTNLLREKITEVK